MRWHPVVSATRRGAVSATMHYDPVVQFFGSVTADGNILSDQRATANLNHATGTLSRRRFMPSSVTR